MYKNIFLFLIIIILNTVIIFAATPTLNSVVVKPINPHVTSDLYGYCNFSDIDGDSLTYDYYWFLTNTSTVYRNIFNINTLSNKEKDSFIINELYENNFILTLPKNATVTYSQLLLESNTPQKVLESNFGNITSVTDLTDVIYNNNKLYLLDSSVGWTGISYIGSIIVQVYYENQTIDNLNAISIPWQTCVYANSLSIIDEKLYIMCSLDNQVDFGIGQNMGKALIYNTTNYNFIGWLNFSDNREVKHGSQTYLSPAGMVSNNTHFFIYEYELQQLLVYDIDGIYKYNITGINTTNNFHKIITGPYENTVSAIYHKGPTFATRFSQFDIFNIVNLSGTQIKFYENYYNFTNLYGSSLVPFRVTGGDFLTDRFWLSAIHDNSINRQIFSYYRYPNITNPKLTIGTFNGTYPWNVTGIFNTTQNITNFQSYVNLAMNGTRCNCDGCYISNSDFYCNIPFKFSSNKPGLLNYSNFLIKYRELKYSNEQNKEVFVDRLDNSYTSIGDQWAFFCRATDNITYSSWAISNLVDVINNNPVIESSNITPLIPTTLDTLYGSCRASDFDNDTLFYSGNWFVNNVSVKSLVGKYTCYQEFTTVGNTCGALNTGNSGLNARWMGGNPIDGNYGTCGRRLTITPPYPSMWSNYTIPINSNGAIFQARGNNGSIIETRNFTVPNSCLDNSDNLLQIYVYMLTGGVDKLYYQCYNGTQFITIASPNSYIQDQTFFCEEAVHWVTNHEEDKLVNISTLESNYTNNGDDVIFSCQGSDTYGFSSWLNSSITYIDFSVPIINNVYITPIYPNYTSQLNCNFNISDINVNTDVNASITWYKNGILNNTYDYKFINITRDLLYTTDFGTGSVIGSYENYSEWICQVYANNKQKNVTLNSSIIGVYPLENLTIYNPESGIYSNNSLNTTFSVIDYNEGINCSLSINNLGIVNTKQIPSGIISWLNYTLINDGEYIWNITCNSESNLYSLYSNNFIYNFDITKPIVENLTTDQAINYPVIGSNISMFLDVYDLNNVSYCRLYMNDTGIFELKENRYINSLHSSLIFSYEIQAYSLANMSNIGWYVVCNDTAGNTEISNINIFKVKDVIPPNITINKLGIGLDNLTVISSYLYDIPFNFTFMDDNLFQAFINVSCEKSGNIYYWDILDLNVTAYTKSGVVNISGLEPQKCYFTFGASDDHTEQKIKKYNIVNLDTGLLFETTENNKIKIVSLNDEDFKSTRTKKTTDRHTFNFNFETKSTEREFIVKSENNNKIYYKPNSIYNAHFVVWNEKLQKGNWIDFDIQGITEYHKYEVTKISDYEFKVRMYIEIPKNVNLKQKKILGFIPITFNKNQEELKEYYYGMDNIKFRSIGGTNILINSYEFYIGGTVNISAINLYNNQSINGIYVNVTNINTYPGVTGTKNYIINGTNGLITNLSQGTYMFNMYKPNEYMVINYIVNITDELQQQVYEGGQTYVNIIFRNIKTGNLIPNGTLNITNIDTSNKLHSYSNTAEHIRFLDVGQYSLSGIAKNYNKTIDTFTTTTLENKTIYLNMIFLTYFRLMNEKTIQPFNITNPDIITFIIICEDSQYNYNVVKQIQDIPILCNYTQFKFDLQYGPETYYRKTIIELDKTENIFNQTVWLVDLLDTSVIYNSIFVDDLLQDYDNVRIFIKKVINSSTEQITADFVDIENKIGAYLIRNHEYIIEIHSDNYPIRLMGTYSADIEGDKNIRLYDIKTGSIEESFVNGVKYITETQTYSDDLYITSSFTDTRNLTKSVTWTVYENNIDGNILLTTTYNKPLNSSISFSGLFNVTQWENTSSFISVLYIDDAETGKYIYSKRLNDIQTITLPVLDIVGRVAMDWFLLMFLTLIALMATIKTGNITAMVVSLLALLFKLFGWFRISTYILALIIMIVLISLIKAGKET